MNETENKKLENIPVENRPSVPVGLETADNKDIVDFLFSNGNKLLTATGGEQELPKDTQGLIAYFSGGEIIISRTHRYDGRVLAFLDLLKKRARPMRIPFYSDLGLVSSIYKAYENRLGGITRSRQDYDNQMQKDFQELFRYIEALEPGEILPRDMQRLNSIVTQYYQLQPAGYREKAGSFRKTLISHERRSQNSLTSV